jgi:hypothetical protein
MSALRRHKWFSTSLILDLVYAYAAKLVLQNGEEGSVNMHCKFETRTDLKEAPPEPMLTLR